MRTEQQEQDIREEQEMQDFESYDGDELTRARIDETEDFDGLEDLDDETDETNELTDLDGDGNVDEGAEAETMEAEPESVEDEAITAGADTTTISQAELQRLRSRVQRYDLWQEDIERAEQNVRRREAIVNGLKEELKQAKKLFDESVAILRATVREHPDEATLPFADYASPAGDTGATGNVDIDDDEDEDETAEIETSTSTTLADTADTAGQADISELGLTEKECEKFYAADIRTVADLESRMRSDEWWHRKIKGVGQAKVDRVTDLLFAYRRENPVPEDDSASASAADEGNVTPGDEEPATSGFDVELDSELDVEWKRALKLCHEIELACEQVPEAGEDFASSVLEKTTSIADWIEHQEHVTEDQLEALQNMREGLEAWMQD
jgi:hypothetical protein